MFNFEHSIIPPGEGGYDPVEEWLKENKSGKAGAENNQSRRDYISADEPGIAGNDEKIQGEVGVEDQEAA